MYKAIFFQVIVILVCALIAGILFGTYGAISAALGGIAYGVPNTWFVLRMKNSGQEFGASKVFYGVLSKLLVMLAFLAAIVFFFSDLHWLSLFIGLAISSQVFLLSFLFTRKI